jgi:hypothetical protein
MESEKETHDTSSGPPSGESEQKMQSLTKVLKDLVRDLLTTYPELGDSLHDDLRSLHGDESECQEAVNRLTNHFKTVFPERFFDILYENEEIFLEESDVNTEFLPGVDYKTLWAANISDATRKTLWKYLQLILFATVSDVSSGESFGDTAKLFEAINEKEFKSKLEETMSSMQDVFAGQADGEEASSGIGGMGGTGGMGGIPNAEAIHEHVAGMMGGKLGTLAQEIAEETANDLQLDMEDASSVGDVFKNLLKNPTKLMGMVKNVGSKLDEKIKSGDINESEILAEASELMKKMKDMPGMGDLQSMMGSLGLGGKGARLNTGAMQAQMDKAMRLAQMKDKMRARSSARANVPQEPQLSPEEIAAREASARKAMEELLAEEEVFRSGERAERSSKKEKGKKKKKKGKGK